MSLHIRTFYTIQICKGTYTVSVFNDVAGEITDVSLYPSSSPRRVTLLAMSFNTCLSLGGSRKRGRHLLKVDY